MTGQQFVEAIQSATLRQHEATAAKAELELKAQHDLVEKNIAHMAILIAKSDSELRAAQLSEETARLTNEAVKRAIAAHDESLKLPNLKGFSS